MSMTAWFSENNGSRTTICQWSDSYALVIGPIAISEFNILPERAVIYQTPNGNLWVSTLDETGLLVSRSTNEGAS